MSRRIVTSEDTRLEFSRIAVSAADIGMQKSSQPGDFT